MPPSLPSFLRRRLLLHEARRALLGGSPVEALESLADPCLALSEEGERLRERIVDVICREAGRVAAEGDLPRAKQLLERVEREDPERARQWRRRIDGESGPASVAQAPEEERPSGTRVAMGALLAEMRREHALEEPSPRDETEAPSRPARPVPTQAPAPLPRAGLSARRPLRFHLAVDDAGEYIAIGGDEVVIGHRSAERADLPILADLEPVQARILRSESFHGGPAWMIQPANTRDVQIDGREVPPGGAALHHDALVQLSERVSFRFCLPDPGSSSALIEFLHGVECEGASRVLLFAQGPAGRVHTGRRRDRHLVVRGSAHEVSLELNGDELCFQSLSGLKRRGEASSSPSLCVSVPPATPLDLTVGERENGRPPFGITLRAATVEGSGEWCEG